MCVITATLRIFGILLSGLRETLPSYVISDLTRVLGQMAEALTPTSLSVDSSPTQGKELDLATECLRCLRNACAACAKNQEVVNRWVVSF